MIKVAENANGAFWDNAASNSAEDLGVVNFPDNTKLLKYMTSMDDYARIFWLYDGDDELFQLIAITKKLQANGKKVELFMPYIPNARMDRVKNYDEVFTLKYFADVINWLGFTKVWVYNPHSTVSEALFDRLIVDFDCVYNHVSEIIHERDTKIDALYFPDEGACKRYGDLLKELGLPIAFGIKKRDWKTGKILGIDVVTDFDLKDKNILMVDDICAYGGTFYYSALKLKELGAKEISCYVTHLENSVLDPEKGKLIKGDLIKKIYATNDIFRGKNEKVEIIQDFIN